MPRSKGSWYVDVMFAGILTGLAGVEISWWVYGNLRAEWCFFAVIIVSFLFGMIMSLVRG